MPEKKLCNESDVWQKQVRMALCLAERVIQRSDRPVEEYDYYKGIARAFLISATDNLRAIRLLMTDGFFAESVILVRRMLELVIDLLYISKWPQKRAAQYLRYDPIQRKLWLDMLDKHDLAKDMGEQKRDVIARWYSEAMKELGYCKEDIKALRRDWSKLSWAAKAEKIGHLAEYDLNYRACCLWSHPTALSFAHVFKAASDGKLEHRQPQVAKRFVAPRCIKYLLHITRKADEVLGTGVGTEINSLWRLWNVKELLQDDKE